MTRRVVLLDYGAGNLRSVAKAFEHEGAEVVLTDDPAVARAADRLVLPGQGQIAGARGQTVTSLGQFARRDEPAHCFELVT